MRARKYHVEWTEVARRDLLQIVDHILDDTLALGWLDQLEEKAAALNRHPHRGRLVPELGRLEVREYRELLVGAYRIIYRVVGDTVFILGIFDGRRNLEDLILKRLLSF